MSCYHYDKIIVNIIGIIIIICYDLPLMGVKIDKFLLNSEAVMSSLVKQNHARISPNIPRT